MTLNLWGMRRPNQLVEYLDILFSEKKEKKQPTSDVRRGHNRSPIFARDANPNNPEYPQFRIHLGATGGGRRYSTNIGTGRRTRYMSSLSFPLFCCLPDDGVPSSYDFSVGSLFFCLPDHCKVLFRKPTKLPGQFFNTIE